MSSLARVFLALFVGGVFGWFAVIVGAIFLPLAFPLAIGDAESTRAENLTFYVMGASLLFFGALGSWLCWRFTERFSRD